MRAENINTLLPQGIALDASRQRDPAKIDRVARELEGAFAKLLISTMRNSGLGEDSLFPGSTTQYRDMLDEQLATQIVSGRGLGLQDAIRRQLAGDATAPATTLKTSAANRIDAYAPATETPEDFVARLWPHAVEAAQHLGVPPKTLLAQAALETGWGQKTIRSPDGSEAHNLFGIKAGEHAPGKTVPVRTTEYVNGAARTEVAEFRAYHSPADSFADYVSLLKNNPRYADVLGNDGDGKRFAEALQRAGYATDPQYAEKISAIAEGPTLRRALAKLEGAANDSSLRV